MVGYLRFEMSHRAFWSSLSFQLRQRIKLRNQSPVWSHLFTVGRGCWLIRIWTESPLESCCLLFPSKETHALLRASSGICLVTTKLELLVSNNICFYSKTSHKPRITLGCSRQFLYTNSLSPVKTLYSSCFSLFLKIRNKNELGAEVTAARPPNCVYSKRINLRDLRHKSHS